MKGSGMRWPDDADGDVLRRLEDQGFDFARSYTVDFNVDFQSWPPPAEALRLLQQRFPRIETVQPDEDGSGYVLIQVEGHLTYEFVTSIQSEVSELLVDFGGVCESWGVLH